ncbi:MAG: ABC transporter permease [bacterium]
MFKNYLTITLRNLRKYKGYSFINIFGLAVGIAVCILIMLFVQDELNYDRFHEKSDRVFRLCLDARAGEIAEQGVTTCAPLAETLVREIPEVETAVRFRNYGFPVFRYGEKAFSEERVFWADSSLFDVFTIPFLKGNPKTVLSQLNALIITETMAKKYFGEENPIGKIINSDNRFDYIVTAVVKDMPDNSHFHFDFIASLARYNDTRSPIWFNNNWYTYVVLREGVSWQDVEKKINPALTKYYKPQIEAAFQTTWEELVKNGAKYNFNLQPVTDIHLNSHYAQELEPNSSMANVYIFSLIALAILCIACFNFMNLSTARYSSRAKEVGIRKTLGSDFGQLVRQFLSESIILVFVSTIISILLVYLLLPVFNDISGKEITLNLFNNFYALPSLLLLILFVGSAAGIYPAFFLASFKPMTVLGGKFKDGSRGKAFRSGLVIFQFSISIILIIGTVIVYGQLNYMQNKNLGYEKEQLLVIHKTDDLGNSIDAFKNELRKNPNVKYLTNSVQLPGMNYGDNLFESRVNGKSYRQLLRQGYADYDFASTFKIKMADGRYYSRERAVDADNSIVLNEAAVKSLRLKNPIGTEIYETGIGDETRILKVVGIMKDFHFQSLHQQIEPLAMRLLTQGAARYTTVRLSTENIRQSVESIKSIWDSYAGNQQFEYTFFNEDYDRLYKSEERTSKLFVTFSILAIMIGCLGLFGLAAYTAEKRTKEIGIRKVLGASIQSILVLLSKEFMKWIVIANVVSWPIAYYLMNTWLQDFAYRIDIGFMVFLFAGGSALIIAIITVSIQAIKTAIANPVESLKYE